MPTGEDVMVEQVQYNYLLLDAERVEETARIKAAGRDHWPFAPKDYQPEE